MRTGPDVSPTDPPPVSVCLLPRGSVTVGRAVQEALMAGYVTTLPRIYVTGHRNPDTDSIAAALLDKYPAE